MTVYDTFRQFTTSCNILQHLATLCNILWQFPSLSPLDKNVINVIKRWHHKRHKASYNIYAILSCPLPPIPLFSQLMDKKVSPRKRTRNGQGVPCDQVWVLN